MDETRDPATPDRASHDEERSRPTRRERLEAKAERRRDWAGKAEARSRAGFDRAHEIADGIPFGQPILVGHHSERRARRDQSRIESGMIAGHEEAQKAGRHEAAADGIERQLATSIFSDDDDAVARLREKVARLEGERDRMKRANADHRREHKAELAAMTPYDRAQSIPYPSYSLSNLGARIREARQRADRLERDRERVERGERGPCRIMEARYGGECADCGTTLNRGDTIGWYRLTRETVCADYVDGVRTPSSCQTKGRADETDRVPEDSR